MKQSEHFRQIRGMKLCKCKVEIPQNQKTCYTCWRRKTRKAEGKSYTGLFIKPAKWHIESVYKENNMNPQILDKIEDYKQTRSLREDRVPIHLMSGMSDKQKKLYKLIHPDGEGLTLKEAAIELGISVQTVHERYNIIEKSFPEPILVLEYIKRCFKGNAKDIKHVYAGYKRFAEVKDLDFSISIEDLEEIIQLPCIECEAEPTRNIVNFKTGNKFKYHHLGRYDTLTGYSYINCYPICTKCLEGRCPRAIGLKARKSEKIK